MPDQDDKTLGPRPGHLHVLGQPPHTWAALSLPPPPPVEAVLAAVGCS